MKRIDGPGATPDNLFTDGDVGLGIQATAIWAKWLNDIQEELALTIEGLGGTLNGAVQNQLLTQLQSYFRNASNLNAGSLPAARFNDAAHGNRGNNNGAAHALANDTVAGFMSPSDFNKLAQLDGVPKGAVIALPTAVVPAGWLECNGASLDRVVYADLFNVIGVQYGAVNSAQFYLPDYRGQFLRGWANGSFTDPDKDTRLARGDGTTGDNVGTRQNDEFQSHTHTIDAGPGSDTATPQKAKNATASSTVPLLTGSVGGSETRPTNIYTMYCIKY